MYELDPEATGKGNKLITTTTLSWSIGPLPPETFQRVPPPGARKVDDLGAAIADEK